jgi:hypothetical protein
MPDLKRWTPPKDMLNRSEPFYARVICNQKTTLTLLLWWDEQQRGYVIQEEGSDLNLEVSGSETVAYRLADMYLDGFREGYDRGYASAEAEHTVRNAERSAR